MIRCRPSLPRVRRQGQYVARQFGQVVGVRTCFEAFMNFVIVLLVYEHRYSVQAFSQILSIFCSFVEPLI